MTPVPQAIREGYVWRQDSTPPRTQYTPWLFLCQVYLKGMAGAVSNLLMEGHSRTEGQKPSIRFLGIDHANAYRTAAPEHLSGAEACYGVYHLASNRSEWWTR